VEGFMVSAEWVSLSFREMHSEPTIVSSRDIIYCGRRNFKS
jgi:hypothetical protein